MPLPLRTASGSTWAPRSHTDPRPLSHFGLGHFPACWWEGGLNDYHGTINMQPTRRDSSVCEPVRLKARHKSAGRVSPSKYVLPEGSHVPGSAKLDAEGRDVDGETHRAKSKPRAWSGLRRPRGGSFVAVAPTIGAMAGLLFWLTFRSVGTLSGSIVRGILIGSLVLYYERGLIMPKARNWIRRSATPLYAVNTILIYAAIIVVGDVMAGFVLHHVLGLMESAKANMLTLAGFAYALGASAFVIFVLRVRDLIGSSVFSKLLLGLYHRPIVEERVFLFIDVVGSTAFAARHGDLRTQKFLGRFFESLAMPVHDAGGEIDEYVGDLAVVTWPIRRGVDDAMCLRCVFAFADVLDLEAASWVKAFGEAPNFRAALHCGSVVTAEIGLERRKISYFGDVVNTTARIEALSKNLDRKVLVSSILLERIGTLPSGMTIENLGEHVVRGKEDPLCIFAITDTG